MPGDVKRITVKLEEGVRKKVAKYAKDNDLRFPRAYGKLIEKGLISEEDANASDDELKRYDREVGAEAKSSLG